MTAAETYRIATERARAARALARSEYGVALGGIAVRATTTGWGPGLWEADRAARVAYHDAWAAITAEWHAATDHLLETLAKEGER